MINVQEENMQLKTLIEQYLADAKMMQLATVANGKPWVCNVWFANDGDMNIYWFSSVTRRHSGEVAEDNHVAGAVCLSQTPEDKPRGLQFEGTAEVLDNEADVQKAIRHYAGRIFPEEKVREFMAHPDKPHKFYKITPSLFVLFDVVNFPDNSRQEWRPNA